MKGMHITALAQALLWTDGGIHSPQPLQIQNYLMRQYILKLSNTVDYYMDIS
jgi:hypothetical protein